jgi:hypothetical protein
MVPSFTRSTGMHAYCKQPDIAAHIQEQLEELEREHYAGVKSAGKEVGVFLAWVQQNILKAKAWSELSKAEKEAWAKESKGHPGDFFENE